MNGPVCFQVKDIFHFSDGRTVFAGMTEQTRMIGLGRFAMRLDGRECGSILVVGEDLPLFRSPPPDPRPRAISTHDPVHLDRDAIAGKRLVLESIAEGPNFEACMHRHLLGVDSPPRDYVPEPTTLGPILPEDWDGEIWVAPRARGYFLRAWNKAEGRVAYGQGPSYPVARDRLLEAVTTGAKVVEFTVREIQPA